MLANVRYIIKSELSLTDVLPEETRDDDVPLAEETVSMDKCFEEVVGPARVLNNFQIC